MTEIIVAVLIALVLVNAYSIYRCIESDQYSVQQKAMQICFVLVLPIIGALLVLHMAKNDRGEVSSIGNYANNSADSYPGSQQRPSSGADDVL